MSAAERHPDEPAWAHGHAHEPNLTPPDGDGAFTVAGLSALSGLSGAQRCTLDWLARLPHKQIADCFIVSTGHGVSGPFVFGGVFLADLLTALAVPPGWQHIDVVSADGFGARIHPADLNIPRPPLLAFEINGTPMTRHQGLVRLIVPAETDDALRQVKWIAEMSIAPA